MLTEREALKQLCPLTFGRMSLRDRVDGQCLGSACAMAWRWDWTGVGSIEDGTYRKVRTDRGYCGLAGRPEVS